MDRLRRLGQRDDTCAAIIFVWQGLHGWGRMRGDTSRMCMRLYGTIAG